MPTRTYWGGEMYSSAPSFKLGAEAAVSERAGVRCVPEFEVGCRDERIRFSCMAASAPSIKLGAGKAKRPETTRINIRFEFPLFRSIPLAREICSFAGKMTASSTRSLLILYKGNT